MAAMMGGEKSEIQIVQTGETRTIDGYDTTGFRVSGLPGAVGNYTVWAADINDVEGARTMGAASAGMMRASKKMMDNMGMGQIFGGNIFAEMMEKMENYYPIVSDINGGQTKLISTDGAGSSDFYPACN
jgi:hypothetical protein